MAEHIARLEVADHVAVTVDRARVSASMAEGR